MTQEIVVFESADGVFRRSAGVKLLVREHTEKKRKKPFSR